MNWHSVRNHYLKLAKANGGILPCALCGKDIDTNLYKHPDPRSMEVDHIIPRTRGGLDTIKNTQASHRECNERKSDDQYALGVLKTNMDWLTPQNFAS